MTDGDQKLLLVLLVAALALVGGGVAVQRLPRGIRLHNPGLIRRTGISWQGEVPDDEKVDAEFEQYVAPEWGIRAIRKVVETKIRRGLTTIREIISDYAPAHENPTDAYVANVAKRVGIAPDDPVDPARDMFAIVDAIIRQENGYNPYPAELMDRGVRQLA